MTAWSNKNPAPAPPAHLGPWIARYWVIIPIDLRYEC
jgi:hypothetical protein